MMAAPARSAAIGFSTNTGLPSLSTATAISGCSRGGTAIATASMSGRSIIRAQSPNASGMSDCRASSAVRAASEPASATTRQRESARNAGSCTARP